MLNSSTTLPMWWGMGAPPTAATPERVRLDIEGGGTVDAIVARVVPGAAELVLAPAGSRSRHLTPRLLHRRRCRVSPADVDDGPMVDGELLAVPGPDGALRDGLIHLLLPMGALPVQPSRPVAGTATYGPEIVARDIARRRFDRVDAIRPVTLIPARMGSGWLDARTRDISAGGVLLDGAPGLLHGERVRVLLELTPGAILDASGRVVRIDGDGVAGVALQNLTSAARARLERHVGLRRAAALAALRAAP